MKIGKFIWRVTTCVIGAAVVGFGGYFLSWGLNLLTGTIMDFLSKAGTYLLGNYVAVIWVVVALIIGGIAWGLVEDWFKAWRAKRAAEKAQNN